MRSTQGALTIGEAVGGGGGEMIMLPRGVRSAYAVEVAANATATKASKNKAFFMISLVD